MLASIERDDIINNLQESIRIDQERLCEMRPMQFGRSALARIIRVRERKVEIYRKLHNRWLDGLTPQQIHECDGPFQRQKPYELIDEEGQTVNYPEFRWNEEICGADVSHANIIVSGIRVETGTKQDDASSYLNESDDDPAA